jgi:enterobactin synthetase component D
MVTSPFPDWVGFAVSTEKDLAGYRLSSEEARLLGPRAVEKRKKEFLLGRAACHTALRRVGIRSPPPILKGPHNEPIWPHGYVGALTHASEIAICAVASAHRTMGIGVDIEDLRTEVPDDVYRLVCTGEELKWLLSADQPERTKRFKMIFSAKEAVFKALFPRVCTYIHFHDGTLDWNDRREQFNGRLRRTIAEFYPAGYSFTVDCRIVDNIVFSWIMLPPSG